MTVGLTISVDRTSMSLAPFILAGHATTRDLSLSSYREPAIQARINYAPTGDGHGDMPLGWSYQETILAFTAFAEVTTEAAARAKFADLAAALGRLSYTVTITVNDGAPETWTCRPGSVVPMSDRSAADMRTFTNEVAVTIPAYPIRSV